MYNSKRLFDEFVDVERNINTGKVDHPPNGSKDMADAVCGAIWNASQNAEQFAFDFGETLDTVVKVSGEINGSQQREQIQLEFEKELSVLFDPIKKAQTKQIEETKKELSNNNQKNNAKFNDKPKEKPAYLDFGMGPAQVYKPQYFNQGIMWWD